MNVYRERQGYDRSKDVPLKMSLTVPSVKTKSSTWVIHCSSRPAAAMQLVTRLSCEEFSRWFWPAASVQNYPVLIITLGRNVSAEAAAATAAKPLQSCPTLCDPIDIWQPTRLPRPWDSPGKNTGVGCHFLLQCMKVKSESEVAHSCPTLSDPMDCSPPGSIHGIFQARVLEWGAIAFSAAEARMF